MAPPAAKISFSLKDGLRLPVAGTSATAIPLLMLKNGEAEEKCGDAPEELYGTA